VTFTWYGHLNFRQSPLILIVLVSWGIAFFEYCFQGPANLKEALRWNCATSFGCMVAAVYFAFRL
jgi:uncharacterized protein